MENLTYFLITRKIFDSSIWRENPHTLKLFVYLIGNARYKDEPKKFNGFSVCKGELVTSLSNISEDNEYLERGRLKKWSRAKVSRMLHNLQDNKYIEILADTYGTHIRVCNYKEYQNPNTYKANTTETEANTTETEVKTYNKEKKDNKEKKIPPYIPPRGEDLKNNGYGWIDADAWNSFVEHRRDIKKPLSKKAAQLSLNFLEKNRPDHKKIIETAIMNRWQGLFPVAGGVQKQEKGSYTSEDAHRRYRAYLEEGK